MTDSATGALLWTVVTYDPRGALIRKKIRASSSQEAGLLSGSPPQRIKSIERDLVAEFIEKIQKKEVSLDLQSAILSQFSAQVMSGGEVGPTFDSIVARTKELKVKVPELRKHSLVSDKLRILGFDPEIVLLAKVGEKAGSLGEVVGEAADKMLARQKMMAEIKKGMIPGAILAGFGTTALIGIPVGVGGKIKEFEASGTMTLKKNVMTHALFGIETAVTTYWWLIIGAIALLYYVWPKFLRLVGGVKPFSLFVDFAQLRRGLTFLSAYRTLQEAGVPPSESIAQMLASVQDKEKVHYRLVLKHLEAGGSLGTSLKSSDWPEILKNSIVALDGADRVSKNKIINRLIEILQGRLSRTTSSISRWLSVLGTLTAVFAIMMIVLGMTLPMLQNRPPRIGR